MSRLRILVTFDYTPLRGFFLKEDLVERLHSLDVEILPSLYDESRIPLLLDQADGVLIPGGVEDVNPDRYGQKKKYDSVKINEPRTNFEFALLREALERDKPLLAICWGLQVLNVFLGGTLHQDIPNDCPSEISHDQKEPVHEPTHWVDLELNGQARTLFGSSRLFVNSTHHQAIDRIAPEAIVEGRSSDGLIECFRMSSADFAWAVQWHPERLKDDPVIPAFLKACQRSRS